MGKGVVKLGEGNWAVKDGNLLAAKETNGRFKNAEFTVARGTRATYVGRDGLIKESNLQDVNLVTNGSFDTDSDWSTIGTWDIVNNQAEAIGNGISQYIQQDFTISNGNIYKFTYEIIENTLNGNGASLSSSGGFGSVSISNVVGTHTEYITASNDTATYALKIGVSGTATSGTIKLDNVSVQEVKTDTPRIDFTDNTDGHLLLEPQSTNLFTYSEDFSDSSWSENLGTVTLTSEVAPNGTTNSVFNYVGSNSNLFTQTQASGVEYTISFFVKSNNQSKDNFQLRLGSSSMRSEVFTATSEWVRYSYTNTPTSSIFSITSDGANDVDILIWGAQLEALSHPTSYIPTNGSTVTRDAETCTGAGEAADFNSEEGVLYLEVAALADDDTSYRSIFINDGTNNNRVGIRFSNTTNQIQALSYKDASLQGFGDYTLSNSEHFNKIAFKYKVNDFALWINGVEVATDTSGDVYTVGTLNNINFYANGGQDFYGKCKAIRVYKEALSDSELTTLTS